MNYEYIPNGVCTRKMKFKIVNNIIEDIQFEGGCMGNLQGITALLIGQDINYVIDKLKGIKCGFRGTSCPDQISKALDNYKKIHT